MNRRTDADLILRSATLADVPQLATWWNNGAVMAHAGFRSGSASALTTCTTRSADGPTSATIC